MQLPRIDAHLSPSHFLTFSLSHFLLHHSYTSDGRRSSVVGRRKKQKHSPPRHKGHKGEKMQATSAEVTEERGLWLVDYSSLI
jgi:hypothetical protein